MLSKISIYSGLSHWLFDSCARLKSICAIFGSPSVVRQKSGGKEWKQVPTPQIHPPSHLIVRNCAWLISKALSHSSTDTEAEEDKERSGNIGDVTNVSCIYCAASTKAVFFCHVYLNALHSYSNRCLELLSQAAFWGGWEHERVAESCH